MDPLLGVHQLNSNITLCLINEASPISSQVYNYCCCHHGMRKVGLNKGKREKHKVKYNLSLVFYFQELHVCVCVYN